MGDSALWKHSIDITFCYGRLSPMETSDRYHLLLWDIRANQVSTDRLIGVHLLFDKMWHSSVRRNKPC